MIRTVRWFLALAVFVLMAPVRAEFVAGEHYEVLPTVVAGTSSEHIEVVEVFSYGCIHCFTFDPVIEGWKGALSDDVKFDRLPAIFSQDWALLAQLYYTAEVLEVLDAVHTPIFNGIHVERVDLRNPTLAAELFEREAEITPEQFVEVSNSFSVRSRVQQASGKTRAFRVNAVPTMVVAGKYRIDGRMAGGNNRMLEIVDHLIELERQNRSGGAAEATAQAPAESAQ